MKNHWGYLVKISVTGLAVLAFSLILFPSKPAQAADSIKVCFCHNTGSSTNPFFTICTANTALQNAHRDNHGDDDFGCSCGDGICDPTAPEEEDSCTCPQDCPGTCDTCGNESVEIGEECGEPPSDPEGTCTDPEVCDNCRCVPPPPVCGDGNREGGEECDGADNDMCAEGDACESDCRCFHCTSSAQCDDGDICNGSETCVIPEGAQEGTCEDGIPPTDGSCQEPEPPPAGGEAEGCVEPGLIEGTGAVGGCGSSKCGTLLPGRFNPQVVSLWMSLLMAPTVIAGILRRRKNR